MMIEADKTFHTSEDRVMPPFVIDGQCSRWPSNSAEPGEGVLQRAVAELTGAGPSGSSSKRSG